VNLAVNLARFIHFIGIAFTGIQVIGRRYHLLLIVWRLKQEYLRHVESAAVNPHHLKKMAWKPSSLFIVTANTPNLSH
jgi:hypothetical protein